MKSLHENRNANRPEVIRELRLIGTTTRTKVRTGPAPSICAASITSPGIDTMKERISTMENGMPSEASASIRPK
ncbi:hypothetical protein RKD37_007610 [Streptomyces ambofaciens]